VLFWGYMLGLELNEMTPVGAGGGRDAPTRADRQGRSRS
jgi:hypothetical protein